MGFDDPKTMETIADAAQEFENAINDAAISSKLKEMREGVNRAASIEAGIADGFATENGVKLWDLAVITSKYGKETIHIVKTVIGEQYDPDKDITQVPITCPLGEAIVNKEKGASFEIKTPEGKDTITIIGIIGNENLETKVQNQEETSTQGKTR